MAEYDIVKDVGTKTETVEKSAKRKIVGFIDGVTMTDQIVKQYKSLYVQEA